MTISTTTLDQQLHALQADNKKVSLAVKLTSKQEREHMAEAYMWWRNAGTVENYLPEQYKANDIAYKKLRNKINFRPLLKLLSGSEMSDTDLDLWNKVLNKVHEEVDSNAMHYVTDTVARISHYVENNGGKTGLAGYHNKSDADFDEVDAGGLDVDAKQVKAWATALDEAEYLGTFSQAAKDFYSNKSMPKVTLPALPQTHDGYSLVIVKKDGSTSNLMSVVNDEKLLNSLLSTAYRKDLNALPVTMRSVLEPLHLLNVPNAVAKNINLFIENSKVENTWIDGKKVPAFKRMVYRKATGDFLLSNVCTDSGVVLIAKPFQNNLFKNVSSDICLSNLQRRSIEVRLLHKQMFNMYTTESTHTFEPMPEGNIYAYQLKLKNKMEIATEAGVEGEKVASAVSNYKQLPISWMPFYQIESQLKSQVDIDGNGLESTWSCDVTSNWLRDSTCEFFDNWIGEYAQKHKRSINKTLKLGFSEASLQVNYEFGEDGHDCNKELPIVGAMGHAELLVRSTDFAFVMRQLAELSIRGAVCIAASNEGIELTFATATHSYTCVIPACDEEGKRSSQLFTQYVPETTEIEVNFDDDDAEIDLTEEEFSANVKALLS